MSDHSSQETHAIVQAGVGIFFQQDVGGFVVVKTIVKGGSAERDGNVQIGDRLLSVDDRSVAGESLHVLRSLILGPQGSVVKMKFARLGSNGGTHDFSVSLIRGTSEYFSEKDSLSRQQTSLLPPVIQSQVVLESSGNQHESKQKFAHQSMTASDSAAAAEGVAILSPSISTAAAGCAPQASVVRTFASSVYKSLYTQAAAPQSHARLFVALEDFIAAYCHHYGCDASSGIRILGVICVSLCCMLLRAVAHVFLLLHQERLYSIACLWTPCSGRVKWCST